MDLVSVLLVLLIVAAIIACAFAIWAARELARAARSVRTLSDDTRVRLMPLLEKTDVAIDALSAELLRIDLILSTFENAADRVSQTTTALHDIANAPERIAGGIAEKVRSWRERRHIGGEASSQGEASSIAAPEVEDTASSSGEAGSEDQPVSEDQWQQIG